MLIGRFLILLMAFLIRDGKMALGSALGESLWLDFCDFVLCIIICDSVFASGTYARFCDPLARKLRLLSSCAELEAFS